MRTKGKNVTTDALKVGDVIILGHGDRHWEVVSVSPARFMRESLRVHVRALDTRSSEIFFFGRKDLMTLAPTVTPKEVAEAQPFAASVVKEKYRNDRRTEYSLGIHHSTVQFDSDGRWVSFLDGEPLADHLDREDAEDRAKDALRYHRTVYMGKYEAPEVILPRAVDKLDTLNKILGDVFEATAFPDDDLTEGELGSRELARRIVKELGITELEGK